MVVSLVCKWRLVMIILPSLGIVWLTKQIMGSANSYEVEVYEVVWLAKP